MVSVDWDVVKSNTKTLGVWLYWIIGTLLIGTISYILYTRFNKQVAAILVFLVSMMALYYYYVKWIVLPGWEVPVGTCPDFMTNLGLYGDKTKNQFLCVDTNGIYKNFYTGATTPLPTSPTATLYDVFKGQPVAGLVSGTAGGVLTPAKDASEANIKTFCGDLTRNKISWIGLCE
jgi:hypothetical protein